MKKIIIAGFAGLLLVSFALFAIITPNAGAFQDNTPRIITTEDGKIFPLPDTSITPRIMSPSITDLTITSGALPSNSTGKFITPSSDDSALPITKKPTGTPRIITTEDGKIIIDTSTSRSDPWFSIDVWASESGTQLPAYMSGTFTAVSNIIGNLESDDWVIYEPMNVAYGTSSSNYVWFQFTIYFGDNGEVQWMVYRAPNGGNFQFDTIPISYTPGHSYSFSFTTSGSNTVTFSIVDNTNSASWSNSYNVPGVTLLYYPNGSFSPASTVEGYTTNSVLTNVPTFTTTIGTGQSDYYYEPSNPDWAGRIPQGIGTNVAIVSSVYYWAMVPLKYATSYYDSDPIGYGSVGSPSDLANTPDKHLASIYGPNRGDGGIIIVQLSTSSGGNIFIDAYSVSGYYSLTYVYVSTDAVNWNYVGGGFIYPYPESHLWAGTYNGAFNYVAVVGYDDPYYGYSVNLRLDAVALL